MPLQIASTLKPFVNDPQFTMDDALRFLDNKPVPMSDHIVPLEVIKEATNNFDQDNLISTGGGLGPAYKGVVRVLSGESVPIVARSLNRSYGLGEVEFFTEVSALSDLNHPNVVSFMGYCDEENHKIIITSYEVKGSLSRFLNSPKLTWVQRLRICLGVAGALNCLRSDDKERGYVVIHRNINSYTILLNENWEPKLSGFEISLRQPVDRIDLVIPCEAIGMEEYTDPAIKKLGGVTCKLDIYSFGVVMFELLCGRLAFTQDDADEFLAPLARYHYENNTLQEIIKPDLWNQMSPQSLINYSKVAYSCIEEDPRGREDLDYIVHQLDKALKLQLNREKTGKKLEYMKIALADIKLATKDFSKRYEIMSTKFYTLYRAELYQIDEENLPSTKHPTLLIKRFCPRDDKYVEEMFYSEVNMLSDTDHPNIVSLHGICLEGSELISVIENLSDRHLGYYFQNVENMRILTWERRVKICIGVARALKYLLYEHEMAGRSNDISVYNVELDESWGAKLFDFRLSAFLPLADEDKISYIRNSASKTHSHALRYMLSVTSKGDMDVYNFGVLMFELLYGRSTNDDFYGEEKHEGFSYWAKMYYEEGIFEDKMIDPIIKEETRKNSFTLDRGPLGNSIRRFVEIACQCVQVTKDERPGMIAVVKELERVLCILEEVECPPADERFKSIYRSSESDEEELLGRRAMIAILTLCCGRSKEEEVQCPPVPIIFD